MTAAAASTPKWRVSDEDVAHVMEVNLTYRPQGTVYRLSADLLDARALIAERDAEIARLRAESDCFVEQIHIYKTGVEHRELRQMVKQAYAQVDVARAAGIAEGLERAAKIAENIANEEPWPDAWPRSKRIAAAIRAAIATASKGGDER